MAYYFSRRLKVPFEDTVQKLTHSLKQQGFGVITTIDVRETLKQKLNIEFRKYLILGACNPEFAISPLETLDKVTATSQLSAIAREINDRLRRALDDLHRDGLQPGHAEALPTNSERKMFVSRNELE